MNKLDKKIQPLVFRLARIVNKAPAINENLSVCISRSVFNIDCISIVVTLVEIILTRLRFYMPLTEVCFIYILAVIKFTGIIADYYSNDHLVKLYKKWLKNYTPCAKELILDIIEVVVLVAIMASPIIASIIYYNKVCPING